MDGPEPAKPEKKVAAGKARLSTPAPTRWSVLLSGPASLFLISGCLIVAGIDIALNVPSVVPKARDATFTVVNKVSPRTAKILGKDSHASVEAVTSDFEKAEKNGDVDSVIRCRGLAVTGEQLKDSHEDEWFKLSQRIGNAEMRLRKLNPAEEPDHGSPDLDDIVRQIHEDDRPPASGER